MPTALLRFDVGPGIGAGHMSRCLALAEALENRCWETVCAVNADGLSSLPGTRRSQALAVETPDTSDGDTLVRTLGRRVDLAVVDHYQLGAAFETALRARCDRIAVIDDLADRRHDADVLIDTAPGQSPERYDPHVASGTLRLLGSDYALLRSEFKRARMSSADRASRPAIDGPAKLLVSLGAVDSKNVSALVLQALAAFDAPHELTVVLGSEAPHLPEVAALVKNHPFQARLQVNPDDMAGLFAQHDIGIGAAGTSALERAAVGLPQILIETAENQSMVARGFAEAAITLGHYLSFDATQLRRTVNTLITNISERERLAEKAQILVDGLGAERVSAVLTSRICDRNGAPLAARRLRPEDSDAVFDWQTSSDTRRYFHDPEPPSRAAHEKFMCARLASRQSITEIVTRHDRPVAMVRADPGDDIQSTVSIVVDPAARRQGIGVAALKYLHALLPDTNLKAVVIEGNAASVAAFRSAGFGVGLRRELLIEPRRNASAVVERDRVRPLKSPAKSLFVLGTVQLGMEYGVTNRTGRPQLAQAFAILDAAKAAGVTTIDTAHAYGASEQVIGNWVQQRQACVQIVTKVPALDGGGSARADRAFSESLDRLGVSGVDVLLLHRAADWHADGVAGWIERVRETGRARRIGVSVYSASDIPDDPRIDVIQVPGNIFNQRALTNSSARALLARGGRVHVRSVFAQGALLADPEELPTSLAAAKPFVGRFQALAARFDVHPAAIAIQAVCRLLPDCDVVLGVETAAQLAELTAAARAAVPDDCIEAAIALGRSAPPELFDPRQWQVSSAMSPS